MFDFTPSNKMRETLLCVAVLVLLFYIYMARRIIQVVLNGTTKPRRQTGSKP